MTQGLMWLLLAGGAWVLATPREPGVWRGGVLGTVFGALGVLAVRATDLGIRTGARPGPPPACSGVQRLVPLAVLVGVFIDQAVSMQFRFINNEDGLILGVLCLVLSCFFAWLAWRRQQDPARPGRPTQAAPSPTQGRLT